GTSLAHSTVRDGGHRPALDRRSVRPSSSRSTAVNTRGRPLVAWVQGHRAGLPAVPSARL
ncbi:MAG: hypothetical protein AVDCRST_MAG90-3144, partial [uncultured Microvirga sp.]